MNAAPERELGAEFEGAQVCADATLIFPLLVAATWGKAHWDAQANGTA
jgi:deoxyhypusine synthase